MCNKEQFPLINKEVHHLAKQNSPEYQHKSYASCVKNNNNNIITKKKNLNPFTLSATLYQQAEKGKKQYTQQNLQPANKKDTKTTTLNITKLI